MRSLKKTLRWTAAAAWVFATGCSDGPTSPIVPANSGLSGNWHGTAHFTGGVCADESVTVRVTETPSVVGVDAPMPTCFHGHLQLRLQPTASALSGEAHVRVTGPCPSPLGNASNVELTSHASGTASNNHLHVDVDPFPYVFAASCSRPGVTLELER